MAELSISGGGLGNALNEILMADDIQPGDQPSYQLAKLIYAFHPLGAKLVDSPIVLAQSQKREVAIPKGPENRLTEAYWAEWNDLHADKIIANVGRLAMVYGISSLGVMIEGQEPSSPLDYSKLYRQGISFNVFDPLNTAGSLVLNQDPTSLDFQKVTNISVGGKEFHRSRSMTLMNEDPLYIEYTTSAFGFTGRSVYQRALFPLKSFIQTMLTDDLIAYKAGVIVAKIKQPGSIIDRAMSFIAGIKRAFIKVATVGNVISIDPDESIETLNFQNLHNPFQLARKDILDNIAASAGQPAIMLNSETFAEGFGEGTEDAKRVAQYIHTIRLWLEPLYDFFDKIVQHRAWNEEFYKTIQKDFRKEYGKKSYEDAFYEWVNSFSAIWPNLIEEPASDQVMVADVKLKAVVALLEVVVPLIDPENKATFIQAAMDNINDMKEMFTTPFDLDYEAIAEYEPPVAGIEAGGGARPAGEPKAAPPFSQRDSAVSQYDRSVAALADYKARQRLKAKPKPRLLTFEE